MKVQRKECKQIKKESIDIWQLNQKFSCHSFNIIYMIECKKDRCRQRYIGHTKRKLKKRLAEHRYYAMNGKRERVTGVHFSSLGHSVSDLSITVLEMIESNRMDALTKRERFFIQKFDTVSKGLNGQL